MNKSTLLTRNTVIVKLRVKKSGRVIGEEGALEDAGTMDQQKGGQQWKSGLLYGIEAKLN